MFLLENQKLTLFMLCSSSYNWVCLWAKLEWEGDIIFSPALSSCVCELVGKGALLLHAGINPDVKHRLSERFCPADAAVCWEAIGDRLT